MVRSQKIIFLSLLSGLSFTACKTVPTASAPLFTPDVPVDSLAFADSLDLIEDIARIEQEPVDLENIEFDLQIDSIPEVIEEEPTPEAEEIPEPSIESNLLPELDSLAKAIDDLSALDSLAFADAKSAPTRDEVPTVNENSKLEAKLDQLLDTQAQLKATNDSIIRLLNQKPAPVPAPQPVIINNTPSPAPVSEPIVEEEKFVPADIPELPKRSALEAAKTILDTTDFDLQPVEDRKPVIEEPVVIEEETQVETPENDKGLELREKTVEIFLLKDSIAELHLELDKLKSIPEPIIAPSKPSTQGILSNRANIVDFKKLKKKPSLIVDTLHVKPVSPILLEADDEVEAVADAPEEELNRNDSPKAPLYDTLKLVYFYQTLKVNANNWEEQLAALQIGLINANLSKVILQGYTDNTGTAELNETLSLRRVLNMKKNLLKLDVPQTLIYLQAFGEDFASTEKVDEERRVEVILLYKKVN